MAKPLVPVTLYRDDWYLLLGWIAAKQTENWKPDFLVTAVTAIQDAVESGA